MAVEVLIAIAAKIGEYLVAPIGRQFSYLFCYNCNIKNFRKKIKDLENIRVEVQTRVDDAVRRGEAIRPDVREWLTSVNKIMEKSSKFFDEELQVNKWCFNCPFPNLILCYQRSKNAKDDTKVVLELEEQGRIFQKVELEEHLRSGTSSNTISIVGGFTMEGSDFGQGNSTFATQPQVQVPPTANQLRLRGDATLTNSTFSQGDRYTYTPQPQVVQQPSLPNPEQL
ncbi:hypothetical protein L1049_018687 [Liquidambar formosana]|uniref:Uncharacterized protein n=1 Tax=Liquidambar formosana TaxID=63359 RepID=A0AAP0RB17_LIQFO